MTSNSAPLTSWQAALIFLALIVLIVVIAVVKKVYYRYQYNKRYFVIPRVNVRGLSYIGMVVAASVAAIIIIATITSGAANAIFRALPSSRVAIESVLIKIGGLMFGPLLGLFIGAAVDFLTVALSGGVFNYGYLISAMAFGLLAGFTRTIVNQSRGKDLRFAVYSTITILASFSIIVLLLMVSPTFTAGPLRFRFFGDQSLGKFDDGTYKLYRIDVTIQNWQAVVIVGAIFFIMTSIVWVALMLKYIAPAKYGTTFKYLAPVIVMVTLSELVNNLLLLPVFDAEINRQPYFFWFASRLGTLPIVTTFNIIVLYSVYRIVGPLVKYDYTTDLSEDLNKPLLYA